MTDPIFVSSMLDAAVDVLPAAMRYMQDGVLACWSAFGLATVSHGQPAWPFASQLSAQVPTIDRSYARALLTALLFTVAGLVLALAAATLLRRRRTSSSSSFSPLRRGGRFLPFAVAAALIVFAPWPDLHLLLIPATPTSLQRSPTGFNAASIVRGLTVYGRYCVDCHGTDGRGQTPLALSLPLSPPNLAGPLLGRRADGDLFWHIRHGMRTAAEAGAPFSMPPFASGPAKDEAHAGGRSGAAVDADVWASIDFMKANAAGVNLREVGNWQQPVAAPALALHCGDDARKTWLSLTQWRGQRVRLIASASPRPARTVREDPRFRSLLLSPSPSASSSSPTPASGAHADSAAGAAAIECSAQSTAAWQALAIIAGVDVSQLDGTEFLIDRDGWLRARKPGVLASDNKDAQQNAQGGWSDADMVCRATTGSGNAMNAGLDGLGRLIALMDAEPIRRSADGFPHAAWSFQ